MRALEHFEKASGQPISTLITKLVSAGSDGNDFPFSISDLIAIAHAGLIGAAPPDSPPSREEAEDLLDEGATVDVLELFSNSLAAKFGQEEKKTAKPAKALSKAK